MIKKKLDFSTFVDISFHMLKFCKYAKISVCLLLLRKFVELGKFHCTSVTDNDRSTLGAASSFMCVLILLFHTSQNEKGAKVTYVCIIYSTQTFHFR